ncbi:unnamed protein product [Tilletia controversa]|nr:unnamed protein product [Tilletia controversa]
MSHFSPGVLANERSRPSNTQRRSTGNNLNTANITPPWPAYLTQLFEEVRKGNTKRSNAFNQELETVRKIVNITCGVKLLRHGGERYAVRVLHFLSEVAVLEQRGLSTGPATLYGLIMESLHM